jgi:hypothetical protein
MATNALSFGDSKSFSFDFSEGVSNVYIQEPTNYDIQHHFKKALEPYKDKPITLLLSGGIDSQFAFNVFNRYCNNVKCITFRFMWDDSVVNPGDVVSSKIFADHMGADHTYVDFDLRDFIEDNHVLDFAKEYYFNSPQIATQAKCILDNLDDSTFVIGGEAQHIGYFDGKCYPPGYKPNPVSTDMRIEQDKDLYKRRYVPWLNFANKNNIDLIVDPFYMSSEILYLAYYNNMRVIKQYHEMPYMLNDKMFRYDQYDYKIKYYKAFDWAEYKVPFRKETGFELLRIHYMKQSGNLDYFNTLYRKPLVKYNELTDWYNKRQYQLAPKFHNFEPLLEIFNDYVKDKDIQNSNRIGTDI